GAIFQRNILARHPVILGLFSGAGGRFILYRPGQPPLDAPPVPQVYQLMKSTGHSTMALTQVVEPYLENRSNQAWRASLMAYRSRMQSALDTLDAAEMPVKLAIRDAHDPAEQRQLHGRLPEERRDHRGGLAGIRGKAVAGTEEGDRLGCLDAGG